MNLRKLFNPPDAIQVNTVVPLPYGDAGLHNSIVRLHNLHIDSKKKDHSRFFRRSAVVIINSQTGEKILRYVMGNPGGISISKYSAALDYDAVDALGITFKHDVSLSIRKANTIEVYRWFLSHPDLAVRLSIRLGVVGSVLGVLGFLTGIIAFI